jgi:hypothetical protein
MRTSARRFVTYSGNSNPASLLVNPQSFVIALTPGPGVGSNSSGK